MKNKILDALDQAIAYAWYVKNNHSDQVARACASDNFGEWKKLREEIQKEVEDK